MFVGRLAILSIEVIVPGFFPGVGTAWIGVYRCTGPCRPRTGTWPLCHPGPTAAAPEHGAQTAVSGEITGSLGEREETCRWCLGGVVLRERRKRGQEGWGGTRGRANGVGCHGWTRTSTGRRTEGVLALAELRHAAGRAEFFPNKEVLWLPFSCSRGAMRGKYSLCGLEEGGAMWEKERARGGESCYLVRLVRFLQPALHFFGFWLPLDWGLGPPRYRGEEERQVAHCH